MEVEKNIEEERLMIKVSGRLDSTTSPELEDSINESIEGIKDVTFDFEDLEYISSAGLRILLVTLKMMNKCNGKLKVININESVKEIFEVTGFNEILSIE